MRSADAHQRWWRSWMRGSVSSSGQHSMSPRPSSAISTDVRLQGESRLEGFKPGYELGVGIRPLAGKDRVQLKTLLFKVERHDTQLAFGSVPTTTFNGSAFVKPPVTLQALQTTTVTPIGKMGYYRSALAAPNGQGRKKALHGFAYQPAMREKSKMMVYFFSAKDASGDNSNRGLKPGAGKILGFMATTGLLANWNLSGEVAVTRRDADVTDYNTAISGIGVEVSATGQIVGANFKLNLDELSAHFGDPLSPTRSEDRRLVSASLDRAFSRFKSHLTFNQSQLNLKKGRGTPSTRQREVSSRHFWQMISTTQILGCLQIRTSQSGTTERRDTTLDLQLQQTIRSTALSAQLRETFLADDRPTGPHRQRDFTLMFPFRISHFSVQPTVRYAKITEISGRATARRSFQVTMRGRVWDGLPRLRAAVELDAMLNYESTENPSDVTEGKGARVGVQGRLWNGTLALAGHVGIQTRENTAKTTNTQVRDYEYQATLKLPSALVANCQISLRGGLQQQIDFVRHANSRNEFKIALAWNHTFNF
ncbi:MAG: hypothetical protein HY314_13500 [Acidobacteria bacterium]|nr:hypothetical protein [Acidobacteriota bacterium]